MGSLFSSVKKSYSPLVFAPPPCSYTISDLSGVKLIKDQKKGVCIATTFIDNESDVTILYSHGNACDMGQVYTYMKVLAAVLNVNVVLYDYPGYGLSVGPQGESISEELVYHSVETVWKYYNEKPGRKWIIYGTSLGSGPSCYLASMLSNEGLSTYGDYLGLMLECPLSSVISVVLPEPIAVTSYYIDSFHNYHNILSVDKPTFIIHGTNDQVISHKASESLATRIDEQHLYKFLSVQGAGHNDLKETIGHTKFFDHVRQFIDYCKKKQ